MSPTLLIILDGWGYSGSARHNAIAAANTPNWDALLKTRPHSLLECSGQAVGLPVGQMGNSEVGHMTIGAGRVIYQDLTRIDRALEDGSFASNPVVQKLLSTPKDHCLHIFCLLSPGGVHSHEEHVAALIRLAAAKGTKIRLHAFLDGRDTPPRSAKASLLNFEELLSKLNVGEIATIAGRFYAMDRDNRWERTESAYRTVVEGIANQSSINVVNALDHAYSRGESDEFVQPTVIGPPCRIQDGDAITFMNFRADRARQLARAIVADQFQRFVREYRPKLSLFATLTDYARDISCGGSHAPVEIVFPPQRVTRSLGEYLANAGVSQLRLSESEKYAHVTYFFSGGREEPFSQEAREIIPSPKVPTYDLKPEMSALELTDNLVEHVRARDFDVIICNFANGDMVGHTGNMPASIKAVECIDQCLGRILAACEQHHAQCLITADHGNIESLWDEPSADANTAHTSNPVPLIYVGEREIDSLENGTLADIAPTMLRLLDMSIPDEMTGRSLVRMQELAVSS